MNKVILIGNLVKDPEFSTTSGGINVCNFRLAVSRQYLNKDGEKNVDFLPITAWRSVAERCNKYLKKGDKIAVTGQLINHRYEKNDGQVQYTLEIIASDIEFLHISGTPRQQGKDEYEPAPDYGVDGLF